jgi:hypothetical protein
LINPIIDPREICHVVAGPAKVDQAVFSKPVPDAIERHAKVLACVLTGLLEMVLG